MKKISKKFLHSITMICLLIICALVSLSSAALANDATLLPPDYVGDDEFVTDYPALNISPDNPEIGDETSFLRISDRYEGRLLADFQERSDLRGDEVFDLLICCHNAGDPRLGDSTIAENVSLYLQLPQKYAAGADQSITAQLTSTNARPLNVTDNITVSPTETFQINRANISAARYTILGAKELNSPDLEIILGEDGFYHITADLGDIAGGEINGQFIYIAFLTDPADPESQRLSLETKLYIAIGIALVFVCILLGFIYLHEAFSPRQI